MDFSSSLSILMILLMCGGLLKLLVVIGLLGQGLGISGAPYILVNFALSLALAFLMFDPVLSNAGLSVFSLFEGTKFSPEQVESVRLFLQKNSDSDVMAAVLKAVSTKWSVSAENFNFLSLTYLLTELREAFTFGALLLLPFVVIDLLLSITFSAVGIKSISVMQVALPLKILLFVSVDGWTLLANNILNQYSY